ncbi:unnamed protein product (macronuclear) [Paramecium tetraurelia]|uniref:Chromosome undetermined scaffold_88, whole genome shotgun sequence n=1 Tax=Paramecium tetraurelia TaxID=5888 RepID=Q3SE34_PARTE|nr:uncharacterized protein GSPATT00025374001 [Paramecium tetraurelia]CAI39091.1 ER-type hsp70 [Paramecium tetraurelia]CAK92640.1 unnamed protein product [Paramecium tetraurelia]|eukprot:XP_001460037.1 hypothetical protein (macronuclear) [Paramecium tetraurelia strain d4-2]
MKTIFILVLVLGIWASQYANEIVCPVIGIDLGTTNSCVGIFLQGTVEIIPNERGNRITPSVVAFTDEERLIGEAAKNQATFNPLRTLYDVKRLIGRKYTDPTVQQDKKLMFYQIVQKDNKAQIMVRNFMGLPSKIFAPEEISAIVLKKMKEISETFIGKKVENAVITVPAYFNDAQRQATKVAGIIADLNVLRILNEPTAAAIAYNLDRLAGEKNVLVFHLGGATFDVSVLQIEYGVFEVIATFGDTQLGGEDFNYRVIDHFLKIIKKKLKIDISGNQRIIQKLKREVEKAKIALSYTYETTLEIEDLVDGLSFQETLTRSQFEELNKDLFQKIIQPIKLALEDSNLNKEDIHEIVLTGGSTKIPKIREIVKDFFNGKEVKTGLNPEEAVCYGAAIQGGILCEEFNKPRGCFQLDVTQLSLGVETSEGVFTKVIPRGSIIPNRKSLTFTTNQQEQETVTINVYLGERPFVRDNHKLGTFELTDIPQSPRGTHQIEVTFDIDIDGILKVSAVEQSSGIANTLIIQNYSDRFSQEEIDKMIEEAEILVLYDKKVKEMVEARNSLENYIFMIKNQIEDPEWLANLLSDDEKETIQQVLQETFDWLQKSQNSYKEIYDQKLEEVQNICNPIVIKLYQYLNNDQIYFDGYANSDL